MGKSKTEPEEQVVAAGVLRVGDDTDSDLRVDVLLSPQSLSFRTETIEIRTWRLGTVSVEKVTPGLYQLTLDGETITFFPDDLKAFSKLDIVAHPRRAQRRRESRATRRLAKTERREAERVDRVTRREAKAAQRAAQQISRAPEVAPDDAEVGIPALENEPKKRIKRREGRVSAPKPSRPRRESKHRLRRARSFAGPRVAAVRRRAGARLSKGARWSRWKVRLGGLWVLDQLRQTDVFLLDRIPIVTDEMRLEPGHVHDYEARVASPSLTRYVCTGCGKVRLTPPDSAAVSENDTEQ